MGKREEVVNWSEAVEDPVVVEDLVAVRGTRGAISFYKNLISKLEVLDDSAKTMTLDLQLASALYDLANLCSSTSFSLKFDELCTCASLIRERFKSS